MKPIPFLSIALLKVSNNLQSETYPDVATFVDDSLKQVVKNKSQYKASQNKGWGKPGLFLRLYSKSNKKKVFTFLTFFLEQVWNNFHYGIRFNNKHKKTLRKWLQRTMLLVPLTPFATYSNCNTLNDSVKQVLKIKLQCEESWNKGLRKPALFLRLNSKSH